MSLVFPEISGIFQKFPTSIEFLENLQSCIKQIRAHSMSSSEKVQF